MFKDDEYKVTVYRRKLTPEDRERLRLADEQWAKAEKEADERMKRKPRASSTLETSNSPK